jgi:hypothetical protein
VLPGSGYDIGYRGGGMLDDVSAALFVLGLAMACAGPAADATGSCRTGGSSPSSPAASSPPLRPPPCAWSACYRRSPSSPRCRWSGCWSPPPTAGGALPGSAGVAVLAVAATGINWQTYFVDYAGTMGDPNSELARYLQTRPPDQRAILLGPEHHLALYQELFLIEFPDRIADEIDVAQALPLHERVDGPLTLVLGPTQEGQTDYLRSALSRRRGRRGAASQRGVVLPHRRRHRRRCAARTGLTLTTAGAPAIGPIDPFAPAARGDRRRHTLVWTGQVYWPSNRPMGLLLQSAGPTAVRIGDATAGDERGRIAGGERHAHAAARLAADPHRGDRWRRPRSTTAAQRRGVGHHPDALAAPPDNEPQGLTATYRVDNEVVQMLDPQLNAYAIEQRQPGARVHTPFSAVWRGSLLVDTAGEYRFDAVGSGPFRALIDGQPLFAVDDVVPEQPAEKNATRTLTPGLHPIEVTFESPKLAQTTRRIFQLFWTPPGGQRQLIPPTNLVPAGH